LIYNYFDTTLATQHDQLIERAITKLVLLKSQQAELDNQTGQQLYGFIYINLNHDQPQAQAPPKDQDFIN
jgi:hypothetical protein